MLVDTLTMLKAYHEAGHAVVGHVIGRCIESLALLSGKDGYGGYCRSSPSIEDANSHPEWHERSGNPDLITIYDAGMLSTARYCASYLALNEKDDSIPYPEGSESSDRERMQDVLLDRRKDMLEKLKSVDWHCLSHAYGPADDVPELIEALALPDKKQRVRAYNHLYSNIYHQGTIYQASSYAVPFFIELLNEKTILEKDRIVDFLATLTRGTSYLQVRQGHGKKTVDPIQLAEELSWVQNTQEAVQAGLDTYLHLLKQRNIRVKLSVLHILSLLQLNASFIVPLLHTVYEKATDQRIKASVVKSLGVVAKHNEQEYQYLTWVIISDEPPLVRLTAAIALIETSHDDTPQKAVDLLLSAIAAPDDLATSYEQLPSTFWRLNVASLRLLRSLAPTPATFAIPKLIEWLNKLNKMSDEDISFEIDTLVEMLLFLAFREKIIEKNTTLEDLTAEQQFVLTSLMQCDIVWKCGDNGGGIGYRYNYDYNQTTLQANTDNDKEVFEVTFSAMLYNLLRLGLPSYRADLRAFLKMEPDERDEMRILATKKMLSLEELATYNPQYTLQQLQENPGTSLFFKD